MRVTHTPTLTHVPDLIGLHGGHSRWPRRVLAVVSVLVLSCGGLAQQALPNAEPAATSIASLDALATKVGQLATTDAAAAGHAVFTAADERQSGFGDFEVDLRMVLRSRAGATVERKLELAQMEIIDAGDRLRVVFQTPKAIRGTALLSHGQLTREDDQWLYLPALKRVKKIASRNRSGPFLGSEFSYEDLSSQEVGKYLYRYVGEEACGELRCYVVERRPGENIYSGYLRQVFWIDVTELRTWKVEYYNRGDRLLKTLNAQNFQRHIERFWRAGTLTMQNHVTGKSTELHWENFRYGVGLVAERDFSKTSLRRLR